MIETSKLRNAIELGSDIEFKYKGKMYTILPWTKDGIVIGPQNEDNDSIFKTADDLIDNYKIDGRHMKDILKDIEILLM